MSKEENSIEDHSKRNQEGLDNHIGEVDIFDNNVYVKGTTVKYEMVSHKISSKSDLKKKVLFLFS